MGQLFLSILDLSVKASVLIIAVVFLRLIFKKAPRHIICLLWLLVGLRLVVPFSVESPLSLMPSAAPVSSRIEQTQPNIEISYQQEMPLSITPPESDTQINAAPPAYTSQQTTNPAPIQPQRSPMSAEQIAAIVWMCGLAAFMVYLLLSYLLLRRKVAEAIPVGDGVWKCPVLASPFVLGLFRPRIYISGAMDEVQTAYVLSHERAHISRCDHWTKPIGFVILAVHWFNPLVWLSYILLCRDIELACDERVVKDMDLPARKGYSQALLACSVRSNPLAACPLAFGEVGVKQRIKSVLSYKKPAFWVIIAAVVCIAAASVFFLTDPKEEAVPPDEELNQSSDTDKIPVPDPDPAPEPSPEPIPEEPDTLPTSGDEAIVDLDGDGVEEAILLDSRNHIRINGKDADLGYSDSFIIVDLDPADSWQEIVVERLSSDGEMLHFYRFDTVSWSALKLGEIPGTVEGLSVEDGYISSLCSFRELPVFKVAIPWSLGEGGFVMLEGTNDPGFYYVSNQDWYALDRDIIAYAGLRYDEKSSDETVIEQGTEIWPLGYHLDGWLKVMDENEEKYWINLYRPTPLPQPDSYDPQLYYPLEVPMGTSVAADLDGDGNEEIIYQNFKSDGQAFLTINGFDYSETVRTMCGYQFYLNRESYYITDLERTDGKLEITVFDEGPSGDPVVHFLQYYNNELHFVGDIPWWRDQLRFDGDSYVLGAFRLSVLQTWYAGAAWRYADGQLQFIEQDFYHALERETVLDWTTGKEIDHHYALCDMYVYASKNLSSQPLVLRAGTQFDLLGTDNVAWILLKTLDGEQYWLHAGLDNPDGITNSMEIIAGLDMSD